MVALIIVIPVVVNTLLIVTPVTSSKFFPIIVKIVPLTPVNGEKELISGGGQETVIGVFVFKLFGGVLIPALVSTIFLVSFAFASLDFVNESTFNPACPADLNADLNVASNCVYSLKWEL